MAARGPHSCLIGRNVPRHRAARKNSEGGPPTVTSQRTCPNERDRATDLLNRCKRALYRGNLAQAKEGRDSVGRIRCQLNRDRDKSGVKIPASLAALFLIGRNADVRQRANSRQNISRPRVLPVLVDAGTRAHKRNYSHRFAFEFTIRHANRSS